MHPRRISYQLEFTTREGTRIEFGDKGWRVLNPRQLGEQAREAAMLLVERASETAELAPIEPIDRDPMYTRGEYVANKLGLRMTHRRTKNIETTGR